MIRRFMSIGLIAVASIAGLSSTSEACHHRHARNAVRNGAGSVQCANVTTMYSGCNSFSNAGASYSPGQVYSTSGSGAIGNGYQGSQSTQGMYSGQGYVNGTVGGNSIGNRVIVGR